MNALNTLGRLPIKLPIKIATAIACGALVVGCSDGDDSMTLAEYINDPTILELTAQNPDLESLEAAVIAAGLTDALDDRSATYTVFAPTDAAFAKFGSSLQTILQSDDLTNILQYHIINGTAVDSGTAISLDGQMQTMFSGDDVSISLKDGELFINNAQVVMTDIEAVNGTIHVIDTVLLPYPTITDIVEVDERFNTLQTALELTDLDDALAIKNETYTVFAPTDDAFAALGDTLTTLTENPEQLAPILLYHVLGSAFVESSVAAGLAGTSQTTLNGADFAVTLQNDKLFINQAEVIITDIFAGNGVVHVIDAVITPPAPTELNVTITDAVVDTDNLSALEDAVVAANLAGTLASDGPFTVFAPVNSAFEKLPVDATADNETILYHALSGSFDSIAATTQVGNSLTTVNTAMDLFDVNMINGELYVNEAKVIGTDLIATNGIVHLIDTVLTPPSDLTIAGVAAADPDNFSTLVSYLDMAGLVDALSDTSATYTVFAPTNDAFDKLDSATLNALAADPMGALADVLTYHVFSGKKIFSPEAIAASGASLPMLSGDDLMVELRDDGLYVDNSKVVITDIHTANGIIHVIDTVLVPAMP